MGQMTQPTVKEEQCVGASFIQSSVKMQHCKYVIRR